VAGKTSSSGQTSTVVVVVIGTVTEQWKVTDQLVVE
jgi:hypothetical protein